MATAPIQYLPPADPFEGLTQLMQASANAGLVREKRNAAEAANALQQQYETDVQAAMSNPTPQAFAALTLKYPQQREAFAQGWKMQSEAEQKGELSLATQAYAALNSGRPDIAEKVLQDRITAMKNAGQSTEDYEPLLDLVRNNPQQARGYAGLILSHAMGPEKFADTFGKLGAEQRAADQAPAELAKKQAEATKAGIDAKYAEQQAVLDLEKKGWDIKAVQSDIGFKREANRIALMNAQASRESNSLKREELGMKVQEARAALDDKIRAKVTEAESGAASIDNMLNTVERIKGNKSLDDVVGSLEGRMPGAASLLDDEESDAIALIETLGSQAFLAQIPNIKGMGALSNAEGDKLQSALQNLGRSQSEKQFRASLDEASRLLKKGRETLSKRTGVPLASPDTPAAPGSRPPLSSFNVQSGGASAGY